MFMIYAYAIDTQIDEENRKNQQVFLKIRELGLTDDTIFMDEEPANKKEFEELLDTISHGDTLLVRSVVDMDGDINCLTKAEQQPLAAGKLHLGFSGKSQEGSGKQALSLLDLSQHE